MENLTSSNFVFPCSNLNSTGQSEALHFARNLTIELLTLKTTETVTSIYEAPTNLKTLVT